MVRKSITVGSFYGSWLVLSKGKRLRHYLCRCQCGNEKEVFGTNLTGGNSRSCRSCMELNLKLKPLRLKHGHERNCNSSPTHRSWRSMRHRCHYKKATQYVYYGGRGIIICKRWDKFENFLIDMGERPEGTSLDRIDTNGNYEKSNCRWATRSEQMKNTRRASHYRI